MLSCQNYYQLRAPHPGRHAAEPCHKPGSRNITRQPEDARRRIRIEELTELSHHSLIQYRLPGTGELIPLLQIAPSKTDAERLIPID